MNRLFSAADFDITEVRCGGIVERYCGVKGECGLSRDSYLPPVLGPVAARVVAGF